MWTSAEHLTNVREVQPITIKGFGGFQKQIGIVGDHPLLGEVFVDPSNGYNIVSTDLMRKHSGYLRRVSTDNTKEFLYHDELRSVFTFNRDQSDGFYKISIEEFNREMKRAYPAMCMSIA